MAISVLLMLTELVLTGVVGFQVFLFKQVSAARREHLELRIEIATHNGRMESFDKALEKLEARFEKRLEQCLDTYFNNLNQRNRP
ncbi:hypothetical protein [Pseudomonas sp. Fl5BN2]|uniref:hypothetical protein n=1 Tax=Pseudomonas sp. Fl5BN2 TaxID=2697652 RepID=UPI0021153EE9|nr:hypothetical protein [Pseudomonas sp. Fl5BN2]